MANRTFVLDEHIDPDVATGLALAGIDVTTRRAAGRAGVPDYLQLEWARTQGRVLVTFDDDFLRLDAARVSHAGIAFRRSRKYGPGGLIQALRTTATLSPGLPPTGVIFL